MSCIKDKGVQFLEELNRHCLGFKFEVGPVLLRLKILLEWDGSTSFTSIAVCLYIWMGNGGNCFPLSLIGKDHLTVVKIRL